MDRRACCVSPSEGLMTTDGSLTDAGRALRQELEDRTDGVALSAYDALRTMPARWPA